MLSISDYVLIGTTLFLGTIALIVPTLAELLKKKILAPDLKIYFEENPPSCHQTRLKGINAIGKKIDEPVYYFRFQVANEGKSLARKCEAVVERLSRVDIPNKVSEEADYTPVNLIWGSSYEEFVEINPNRRFFCDLLHVPSKQYQDSMKHFLGYVNPPEGDEFDLGAIMNVKAAFYAQPNRLPPGKYKIDVVIYSENSKEVRRSFIVTWSGNWKDNEENFFKELVIE